MKKILLLIALCLGTTTLFAQQNKDARKVLDATAAKLTKMKSVKANFELTAFQGTTPQGTSTGVMYLSGKKYKMETSDLITWFDGKTQWAYLPENEEVNVSNPTPEEQQMTNPAAFIGIYRSGYNYTLSQVTRNGQKAYEVHLTAQSKNADICEARINVTQDYVPYSIRIKQGKNWTRIRISGLTPQKLSDSTFKFPASQYPNAEVIDLR